MIFYFNEVLKSLAEYLNIPVDHLLDQQEIIVNGIAISFQFEARGNRSSDTFILSCCLGSPNEKRWREVAHMLLQANHFWIGTGGGTMAMLDNNDVRWCMRVPFIGLQTPELVSLLDKISTISHAWRAYIKKMR